MAIGELGPIMAGQQQLPQQCVNIIRSHRRIIAVAAAPAASQQHDTATDCSFEQQLQRLRQWKSQYGSCLVPRSATDVTQLAGWVSSVRRAAGQGKLNEQQKQQLDDLEFVWKPHVVRHLDKILQSVTAATFTAGSGQVTC